MAGDADEHFPDDDELEAWIEADLAADRDAADLLRDALAFARGRPAPAGELSAAASALRASIVAGAYPADWLAQGAGFGSSPPDRDEELVLEAVHATIAPREQTGLPDDEESLLLSMERADWLGSIVELVRKGRGASAAPADLVRAIAACPEIEVAEDWDPEDDALTEATFELVSEPWRLAGVIDLDDRLTELGAWALPRGLARAWGSDFDADA